MKISLIDQFSFRRLQGEPIDNYLAMFRNMKNRCFTPILEAKVVKMAINDLDYEIRKKLVNEQFLDLAQLAEKIG